MNNNDKKIEELFDAGCHLGHKKNRVHPQAKKYIYSFENGVSIIDLTYTVDLLEKAKQFISQLIKVIKLSFLSPLKKSLSISLIVFVKLTISLMLP